MPTHEVLNQPPPLEGYDLFREDRALTEALGRDGASWAEEHVAAFGRLIGRPETIRLGFLANEHPPRLRTHDRFGNRIDDVEFHPAWHELMRLAIGNGVAALPWREPRRGAHVARSSLLYLLSQIEAGVLCPMSMTYAAVPALRAAPAVADRWVPRLTSLEYDPRPIPASDKSGAVCGMAMTEKQGGSDVRANTTRARRIADGEFEITGHKWFCSAPTSDAFLVLAHTERGLSCFLLPRWTPDGEHNRFHLQRLKDKLGNRSNASSEVELDRAWAELVGEEGRGIATIIEMVNHTRLDCITGAAAGMRQATAQAAHHVAHRSAFGKRLADQPLMRNVIADLAIESEAATVTTMRLARGYDESAESTRERAFVRIATAIAKFWICKRAPAHAAEALECLGGNGFVEESMMPRLYREAPLNSIWEGSGNVICLDVLRAMARSPESLDAFFAEADLARGSDDRLDAFTDGVREELREPAEIEARARRIVERLALALQASLLVRHGDPAVADAFLASRIARDSGLAFGTLPPGLDVGRILDRATPRVG
jgi:putative acyl-CoA dehydrogenase